MCKAHTFHDFGELKGGIDVVLTHDVLHSIIGRWGVSEHEPGRDE